MKWLSQVGGRYQNRRMEISIPLIKGNAICTTHFCFAPPPHIQPHIQLQPPKASTIANSCPSPSKEPSQGCPYILWQEFPVSIPRGPPRLCAGSRQPRELRYLHQILVRHRSLDRDNVARLLVAFRTWSRGSLGIRRAWGWLCQ
jgi:hypothetical protein